MHRESKEPDEHLAILTRSRHSIGRGVGATVFAVLANISKVLLGFPRSSSPPPPAFGAGLRHDIHPSTQQTHRHTHIIHHDLLKHLRGDENFAGGA